MDTGKRPDSNIFKVQKKLAYLFAAAGIAVSLVNFFYLYNRIGVLPALTSPSVLTLSIVSLLILLTAFWNHGIARLFQISIIILNAIMAILDVYNSIHGLGLLFVAAFISFKYGYFKKRPVMKFLISILLTSALIEYSAIRQFPGEIAMHGLDAIIYIALFFLVTYLIYSDEINSYIESNRDKLRTIDSLESERDLLMERVKSLNRKISRMNPGSEPIDLTEYGITPAEVRIISTLVLYRATDKEIAERLNLSFHTVKNHFRSIRNKMGVDTREEIIDLCRFNFLE